MNNIKYSFLGFICGSYFNKSSLLILSVIIGKSLFSGFGGGERGEEGGNEGTDNKIIIYEEYFQYLVSGWLISSLWKNISIFAIMGGLVIGVVINTLPPETIRHIKDVSHTTYNNVYNNVTNVTSVTNGIFSSFFQGVRDTFTGISNLVTRLSQTKVFDEYLSKNE